MAPIARAGATVSVLFGAVAADLLGDGRPSLAIVQNLFSREPETGLWRGGLGSLLQPADHPGSFTAVDHALSGFVVDGDGKALALVDLDADGRPDLVATQNDRELVAFRNQSAAETSRLIAVRLEGLAGNPSAIGPASHFVVEKRLVSSHEVTAGSGYLSQSTACAFFTIGKQHKAPVIRISWPGGKTSETKIDPSSQMIRIQHPDVVRRPQNQ